MPLPALIPLALKLLPLAGAVPEVIRLLGGEKAADVAEKVVGVAKAITGQEDPAKAVDAVLADPNLQLQFQQSLIAERLEYAKIEAEDRKDARARDREFIKAGKTNLRADLMVMADALGLVACLIILGLYRKDLPGEAVALISTVASIFGLCLRDAHQFEFGSSRGSKEKDELLKR